jgi:hypothetical protein
MAVNYNAALSPRVNKALNVEKRGIFNSPRAILTTLYSHHNLLTATAAKKADKKAAEPAKATEPAKAAEPAKKAPSNGTHSANPSLLGEDLGQIL